MRKIKTILGAALFIAGFICSAGQREDGGPAPAWTLGSAVVMIIGGNILSKQFENDGEE